MQQIDITRRLLLTFAEEYLRVPDVTIGNPYQVKAPYSLLVAWFSVLVNSDDTDVLGIAFTGWLCGRNEFVLMDEAQKEFAVVLVALCGEVIDTKEFVNGQT